MRNVKELLMADDFEAFADELDVLTPPDYYQFFKQFFEFQQEYAKVDSRYKTELFNLLSERGLASKLREVAQYRLESGEVVGIKAFGSPKC